MRLPAGPFLMIMLAACTQTSVPAPQKTTTLPFFGDGYPTLGAPCRQIGESAETVEFLDHTALLVGCPETMKNLDVFEKDQGAVEVLRKDGFVVYSVPTGV